MINKIMYNLIIRLYKILQHDIIKKFQFFIKIKIKQYNYKPNNFQNLKKIKLILKSKLINNLDFIFII